MSKTNWKINDQPDTDAHDIPVRDIKSLPFGTLFDPNKNGVYKAYQVVRDKFCPDCFKVPFEIPDITDNTRDCCAEFMIATLDEDWAKMYDIATNTIKSTFSEEISIDTAKVDQNKEEVQNCTLRQAEAFHNLQHQQQISSNSSGDNFINLAESEYREEYDQATKKLKTSHLKLSESQMSLFKTTGESIDKEFTREAHKFHQKISPNDIALSDDEIRQKLEDGLKNDPHVADWYSKWSQNITNLKIKRKPFRRNNS